MKPARVVSVRIYLNKVSGTYPDFMSFEEITARYKKDGFRRISWDEYEKVLQTLLRKIQNYLKQNKVNIDIVVPILRGGAFPGTYLAYKLNLLRIVPVQYKYFFKNGKIELLKMLGLPNTIPLPQEPVILLVENNHCFGLTAATAAKDIKQQFPYAKIIYAADFMDYSYQKNELSNELFFGKLNNDTKTLSQDEALHKGFETASMLFPWEDEKEEWTTVEAKQFPYQDVIKARVLSEFKAEMKEE